MNKINMLAHVWQGGSVPEIQHRLEFYEYHNLLPCHLTATYQP